MNTWAKKDARQHTRRFATKRGSTACVYGKKRRIKQYVRSSSCVPRYWFHRGCFFFPVYREGVFFFVLPLSRGSVFFFRPMMRILLYTRYTREHTVTVGVRGMSVICSTSSMVSRYSTWIQSRQRLYDLPDVLNKAK